MAHTRREFIKTTAAAGAMLGAVGASAGSLGPTKGGTWQLFSNSVPRAAFGNRTHYFDVQRKRALKEKLAQIITTSPDVLQFAKDKKYEEAWIIKSSETRPSAGECKKYLDKETFGVLIVEYVWNSDNDDKRFVLTMFQDKACKLQNADEFVKVCLDFFYGQIDFSNLINGLDQNVIGREYLFKYPVESASMGVFNHWFSVGPVDLWKAEDRYNEDEIKEKLESRLDVVKTKLNYQGLFFRFNASGKYNGPYYGLKTPCCKKDGDFWIVDFSKTFYWMKFMLVADP